MRHFEFLEDTGEDETLFHVLPQHFDATTDRNLLAFGLGATLYMPATRETLMVDLAKMRAKDATSVVVCLEDSIPDERVEEAEVNLANLLRDLDAAPVEERARLPLVFVRPRTPEHLARILATNGALVRHLTGFVFPKFDNGDGRAGRFVNHLEEFNLDQGLKLYYMPVIESPSVIHRETRKGTLAEIRRVLDMSSERVLAVRIGATDMSSSYGLRRSRDFTVHDVHVVASAISDIVNVLGRAEDNRVITGAVWEHFAPSERTFKPQLRESLFPHDQALRAKLLAEGNDTFIREIQLDKLNGITGKTVIHPSHIAIVHSLMVVSHEEYSDALDILSDENSGGGARSSLYRNKMNEVKPHAAWARNTLARAHMFGVAREGIGFVDFLERYMG